MRLGPNLYCEEGNPDIEVSMCLGPMPPDASDFPGGIPALEKSPMSSLLLEQEPPPPHLGCVG